MHSSGRLETADNVTLRLVPRPRPPRTAFANHSKHHAPLVPRPTRTTLGNTGATTSLMLGTDRADRTSSTRAAFPELDTTSAFGSKYIHLGQH